MATCTRGFLELPNTDASTGYVARTLRFSTFCFLLLLSVSWEYLGVGLHRLFTFAVGLEVFPFQNADGNAPNVHRVGILPVFTLENQATHIRAPMPIPKITCSGMCLHWTLTLACNGNGNGEKEVTSGH